MTYITTLIEHTDTKEKNRFLRLLDLMSVYEPLGFVKSILMVELEYFDQKGKFETPFHIAKVNTETGALVGYAFYYPKEKTCEFYVLPHWRGKGVGTLLVNAIRENWSGNSVLGAYRGFAGWRNFFTRNFILEMGQFVTPSRESLAKYGDWIKARNAEQKAAKMKMYRQMVKAGVTTVKDVA
jgi:GNAT superfamily N-acetyltransferase